MQFTLDHGRRGFCVIGDGPIREGNVNVGRIVSKRLVRLGWVVLALAIVQLMSATPEPHTGLSRTARLPPLETPATDI